MQRTALLLSTLAIASCSNHVPDPTSRYQRELDRSEVGAERLGIELEENYPKVLCQVALERYKYLLARYTQLSREQVLGPTETSYTSDSKTSLAGIRATLEEECGRGTGNAEWRKVFKDLFPLLREELEKIERELQPLLPDILIGNTEAQAQVEALFAKAAFLRTALGELIEISGAELDVLTTSNPYAVEIFRENLHLPQAKNLAEATQKTQKAQALLLELTQELGKGNSPKDEQALMEAILFLTNVQYVAGTDSLSGSRNTSSKNDESVDFTPAAVLETDQTQFPLNAQYKDMSGKAWFEALDASLRTSAMGAFFLQTHYLPQKGVLKLWEASLALTAQSLSQAPNTSDEIHCDPNAQVYWPGEENSPLFTVGPDWAPYWKRDKSQGWENLPAAALVMVEEAAVLVGCPAPLGLVQWSTFDPLDAKRHNNAYLIQNTDGRLLVSNVFLYPNYASYAPLYDCGYSLSDKKNRRPEFDPDLSAACVSAGEQFDAYKVELLAATAEDLRLQPDRRAWLRFNDRDRVPQAGFETFLKAVAQAEVAQQLREDLRKDE